MFSMPSDMCLLETLSSPLCNLSSYLYSLIKRQRGQVSLLEYALESGMGAEEARAYLESRANEFGASVVVSEQGETIYQFPTGERSCLS
jgi:hypothetical protein